MNEIFSKSIFSFCLCNNCIKNKIMINDEVSVSIGSYTLFADKRTPLQHGKIDGREIIIFGYAVDVFSGQSDNLSKTILESTDCLDDVIEYERKLGGKYIIFYSDNDKFFCLGDATCSIPLFYTSGLQNFMCSSYSQLIVNSFDLKKDSYLSKIRESGKLSQAMPYDVTSYKEVKRLLPNHYLDVATCRPIRFINCATKQKRISSEEAVKTTSPMIEKITNLFLSRYKIYCPLTAGKDSRVIYAYLKKLNEGNVHSYTVWLDHLNSDRQDWDIPVEIAKSGETYHEQISLEEVEPEDKVLMDVLLGENGYPQDAFSLSLTINKHYGDGAIIEGDILGQIAQCHLHRNIPNWLASPRYFRCKVHNYSDGARRLMKEWMKEIKMSNEHVNIMDLFSVENRLGVWAAYTHLIRNTIGLVNLNCFNSRSIIYVWTAIDPAERMRGVLNVDLIKGAYPETLEIPFGSDSKLVKIAKTNALTFYLSSFAKYYIEREKFKRDN